MNGSVRTALGSMTAGALLGIVLGVLMLFYPGGTMLLMASAFRVFQFILSLFIVFYSFSEGAHYIRSGRAGQGILSILLGLLATLLLWLLNVGFVYFIVALFLVLSGVGEIVGSFRVFGGNFFLAFLGIVNILVAVLILSNPVILPLLIAWYVLFWGISRLFLSMELRRLLTP
ncbi:MAG: hypothetical protein PHN82_01210 [bacterium]|nr:hypothetical protein [bacterium]